MARPSMAAAPAPVETPVATPGTAPAPALVVAAIATPKIAPDLVVAAIATPEIAPDLAPETAPARILLPSILPARGTAPSRLISFEGVSLRFGPEPALQDFSLAVDPGELIALVGPSGAGKTSTLKLLQGLVRPTSGRLWIDGVPVHNAWPFRLRRLRRRIGVVFQDYRLLANRSALENVAYALQVSDLTVPRSEARRRAAEQLELVGLGKRIKARPDELSGGQQQRIAIARALVTRPRILLADEPTASLDEAQAKRVLGLFREISDRGTTVVIATHDRTLLNGAGARIVRMSKGRLISDKRTRGKLWLMS